LADALCITRQHKYGSNYGVGRAGHEACYEVQIDSELGTKYWQDQENTYEKWQSV